MEELMVAKEFRNRYVKKSNPAGNPLLELEELELKAVDGAGRESEGGSCGFVCTWSSECQGRYTISCCE